VTLALVITGLIVVALVWFLSVFRIVGRAERLDQEPEGREFDALERK